MTTRIIFVGFLFCFLLVSCGGIQEEVLSEGECLAIANNVTENMYNIRPQWVTQKQIRSFDALYRFECPDIHITVNGRGTTDCRPGYVVGIGLKSLLEGIDSKGYFTEEQALNTAKEYIRKVVGFVPAGELIPRSLGSDTYPHWRVSLERYTNEGVFVDTLIIVTIHDGNVISYVCRDFPDSDVTDLSVDPKISVQEAKKIAKGELNSPLRRAFDEPLNVELGFVHPSISIERTGWNDTGPFPAMERSSDSRIPVWRVQFDDLEIVVDVDSGMVLEKHIAMTSHSWGREILCLIVIATCLVSSGIITRVGVKRYRSRSRIHGVSKTLLT